jgi:Saccharopine dehydrogenase NADP binding domain
MSPKSEPESTKSVVAVFGASGYTGRFVIAELLRRGVAPIAIARKAEALSAAGFAEKGVPCRVGTVDDAASLDRALYGAQAVINCAGPFMDTAEPIANAALRAGAHYIDVAAEQDTVRKTLEYFDEPARKAGKAVVPSTAFYGGLSDLIVSSLLGDWDAVDSIEILMGMDSWRPTPGTRTTIERNIVGNLMITGGRLTPACSPPKSKRWSHSGAFHDQAVIEAPFSESIVISRHVKVSELHNFLPLVAVNEVLNKATPNPAAFDSMGRSAQKFAVDVIVTRGNESRRAIASGHDIYAVTAPITCEAAKRLIAGGVPAGTHTLGQIFDGKDFLESLGSDHLIFEIATA